MSKKSNIANPLIANASEIKRVKEQWLETSKTNLPLVIIGDSGVGKSFWIEKSISDRVKEKEFHLFRIDYSQKKEYFEKALKQIKKDQVSIIWWENFFEAPELEIKNWLNWWKAIKYELPKSMFIYWEIQTGELTNLKLNSPLEELYEMFKSFSFNIHPLHRRQSDLPFFVLHFLENANRELKKNVSSLDEQFHHFFTKRNFKHNLHDLRDFIYSLVAYSTKKHIRFNQLPTHFLENQSIDLIVKPGIKLEIYEKAIISENLKFVNGNRTKAAKLLGISERNLYRKIKEYQIEEDN